VPFVVVTPLLVTGTATARSPLLVFLALHNLYPLAVRQTGSDLNCHK